ncbi:hypothetical protein Tco_1441810 [Tanacetum coccineum]
MVREHDTTDSSESEWQNPFVAKNGGDQENNKNEESCFHLNEDDELPYPKFKKEVERILANEVAYPTADEASSSGIYNPPIDSMMGPPVYPPSTGNYQQYNESQFQPKSQKWFKGDYGNYHNQQWSLPPAYAGLWDDTISRWETITIKMLNSQSWSDNKSKLLYVENLLGEQEKLMWQQWRTAYPEVYEILIGMADDPQNITSHMRTVIMMEDPYRGSTERQDIAQRDLDRLTCEDTKDLWRFMHEFRILAINSFSINNGKVFFKITTNTLTKSSGGVQKKVPRIDCREGHFARDCKSKSGNIARSAVYQELDIPKEWDIVSADFSDKSSVYSISEGEGELHAGIAVGKEEFIFMVYEEDYEDESDKDEMVFMVRPNFDTPTVTYFPGNNEAIEELRRSAGRWRPHKELPKKSRGCTHDWKENPVTWYNRLWLELQELRNDQERRISWVHEENLTTRTGKRAINKRI